MDELLSEKIEESKMLMDEAIEHFEKELLKVRTGKASPSMLSGLMVNYYGAPAPIHQVANVGTSGASTITIQPFEKSLLGALEKAVFEANLGFTPMNNGETIMINIPPLTEERRREMTKKVASEGEKAKISIRNARREAMDAIKREVKDGFPEDAGKRKEEEVQKFTDSRIERVESIVKQKSEEVMTL